MFYIYALICFIKLALFQDTNSIVDTETLTSIIKYSLATINSTYATVATTPQGNLILCCDKPTIVPKKIRGIVPIIHNDNNEKKFLYSTYVVEPSI